MRMGDDARFSSAGKRQCRFPAILVFAATARAGFAVALLWSATALAASSRAAQSRGVLSSLTPREREVLGLLVEGLRSVGQPVRTLREEYSIYAIDTGRICVAALNSKNIDYVAGAIASVIR